MGVAQTGKGQVYFPYDHANVNPINIKHTQARTKAIRKGIHSHPQNKCLAYAEGVQGGAGGPPYMYNAP